MLNRIVMFVVLLLVLAVSAYATPVRKGCPPTCKHRAQQGRHPAPACESRGSHACRVPQPHVDTVFVVREVASAPAPVHEAPPLWNSLVSNFEVNVGWSWHQEFDRSETVCLTRNLPPGGPRTVDPFFVGFALRLPLAPRLDLCGNWDRQWTDAPLWDARLYGSFRPFGE